MCCRQSFDKALPHTLFLPVCVRGISKTRSNFVRDAYQAYLVASIRGPLPFLALYLCGLILPPVPLIQADTFSPHQPQSNRRVLVTLGARLLSAERALYAALAPSI